MLDRFLRLMLPRTTATPRHAVFPALRDFLLEGSLPTPAVDYTRPGNPDQINGNRGSEIKVTGA